MLKDMFKRTAVLLLPMLAPLHQTHALGAADPARDTRECAVYYLVLVPAEEARGLAFVVERAESCDHAWI